MPLERSKEWWLARIDREGDATVGAGVPDSITCPKCGRTSYNANDIRERYCGNCHQWHDDMLRGEASV